jgi:hypothetical protein
MYYNLLLLLLLLLLPLIGPGFSERLWSSRGASELTGVRNVLSKVKDDFVLLIFAEGIKTALQC